jgi:hypothetical protein
MAIEEGSRAAAPRKRRLSRGVIVLMILTALAVVAPLVASVVANRLGFGLGATDVFQIGIRNDTPAPLSVRTCGADCLPDARSLRLDAGSSGQVTVSDRRSVTYYLVDGSGQVVGCLPVRFTRKVSGFTVLASRAEACPGKPMPVP